MKFIKKSMCILLALLMAASALCIGFISASAATAEDLTFSKIGTSAYKISGCSATATGALIIPDTHDGLPVTQIDASAFDGSGITSVTIPASIAAIGANAFGNCLNLSSVTFQGTTVSLGVGVFNSCASLNNVTLPAQLKHIPERTFDNCILLEEISIPSTVTTIGANAFRSCASLRTVNIPAAVAVVGDSAFSACISLTDIAVESASTAYKAVDGVLFTKNGTRLVQYPIGNKHSAYTIPEGTLAIATMAFGKSKNLQLVTIADSVESIEPYAFSECSILSRINLNNGLKTIGSLAFQRCSLLKELVIPSTVTSYSDAFYLSGLETVVISNGVALIDSKAFEACASLKRVSIPQSVTKINLGAFANCSALEALTVPDTVTTISANAFIGITDSITLRVEQFSAAHQYAIDNSIDFIVLDSGYIEIANPDITDYTGTTVALSVTVIPADGNVIWTSSNTSVATVDASGVVSLANAGQATITATLEGNSEISDSITVTSIMPTIDITNEALELEYTSELLLAYNVTPINAIVTWSSSNPSVITVDNEGKVTAVGTGSATVTATVYGQSAAFDTVTITVPECILDITAADFEVKLNSSAAVPYTVSPERASVIWSSSNPKVVTVSEDGTVTAVGKGSAVITAEVDGQPEVKDSVTVTAKLNFWQKIIWFFKELFRLV